MYENQGIMAVLSENLNIVVALIIGATLILQSIRSFHARIRLSSLGILYSLITKANNSEIQDETQYILQHDDWMQQIRESELSHNRKYQAVDKREEIWGEH